MKISQAFDLYGYHMALEGQSKRAMDHNDYIKRKVIEELGDIKLKDLTTKSIYQWREAMVYRKLRDGTIVKRKPNSLRADLLRMRCMLKYMGKMGYKCPKYELVPVPRREDNNRVFLTEEEVSKMIQCAWCLKNKFIISLLYSSGIRVSELVSLDRDSILNKSFSVVGKGKKLRLCFIDERTEKLMAEYLATRKDKSKALIVSDLYKDRMSVSNIQLIIRNSAKRAGITKHVTPHTFRHSFATNFVRNNGGIKPLSLMLGHASLNTTAIYTHLEDNELRNYYNQFHTV